MVTIGDLIDALSKLPPDTKIVETSFSGIYDVEPKSGLFLVYEKSSVVELHIDDASAYHEELEGFRRFLL